MKNGEKTPNVLASIAKKGMQNMIIIAALAVLVLIFWALNPNFLNKFNIVSMAQSLAPYAIMGLGVTFVIATGGIDLSIGTVCIASAVLAGKMYTTGMIPLWVTIPVMIGIGLLFGFINGLLVAKLKIPNFIATLGTMMVSRGLSALIVADPNIFFPSGSWYNKTFSNANGIPTGIMKKEKNGYPGKTIGFRKVGNGAEGFVGAPREWGPNCISVLCKPRIYWIVDIFGGDMPQLVCVDPSCGVM